MAIDRADTFVATPTLMIGLGGTGLKVATFVKKSLLETNHNVLPRGVAFLVLDTEQIIKFKAGGWGRARDEFHATGPVSIEGGEYFALTGNVKQVGETIKREQKDVAATPAKRASQPLRHMNGWFQAQYYIDEMGVDAALWNLDVGAGRLRQFGRLALFQRFANLGTLLRGGLQALKQQGATKIYVHVAGSLAGGTGAALFLDVAHLVKQYARTAGFAQSPGVLGHFVLPEGFRGTPEVQIGNPNVRADFDARCFAGLRELTRLQGQVAAQVGGYPMVYKPDGAGPENEKLTDSLYSYVYLYDGVRGSNPLNTYPIDVGLAPSIADTIVSYIDDRSSGAFCSHSVNYQTFYGAYKIPAGQVTYGTTGSYTIELPIYHITEGWSHDLARQAMDALLRPVQRDLASNVPSELASNLPGGKEIDPAKAAEDWLRNRNTALVQQLAEWGRQGRITGQMLQEAVDAVLQLDAGGWQLRLAPTTIEAQPYVTEAQTELDGSLKVNQPSNAKYYVDHKSTGDSNAVRASNLQTEVEDRLRRMVGREDGAWEREGGEFGRALTRLGNYHAQTFDKALIDWLKETLNGDPNLGDALERKQGKIGYIQAFLTNLDTVLKASSRALAEAKAQAEHKRKQTFDALQSERIVASKEMQKAGGLFNNANSARRSYRDLSDNLAQFHKADIARKVVSGLVERLQLTVEQALKEVRYWTNTLGIAPASDGGAYALLLEGQRDVVVDRDNSARNVVRWVISDTEPGDTYIANKRDSYARGKLAELLRDVNWSIGRDDRGEIMINFEIGGTAWSRRAGSAGQRAGGGRNLATLLDRCRAVFAPAWGDMSVTEYLSYNYENNVAALAQRIKNASGFPLEPSTANGDPPMRTTFMRVFKEGLNQKDIQFLTNLRSTVAEMFGETHKLEREQIIEQQGATVSGEDSRDRFKLTFVMFGDLINPDEIKAYIDARENYRQFSGGGRQWRQLHILPAETNALQIECLLSTGRDYNRQRRRELSEEVVTVLENIDRFRLAMRCLAYGDTDYDWRMNNQRGVLLHKHTPPGAENPNSWSYWRLTVAPEGERRADGLIYDRLGRARPVHYQLSDLHREPDLLQAMIQLVALGQDTGDRNSIDLRRVEATVQLIMDQHAREWSSPAKMGWTANDRAGRDLKLQEEAHDKAAQIIRLNAYIASIDEQMELYRWAWAPGGSPPPDDSNGVPYNSQRRIEVQKFIDLLTALRGAALEEMDTLDSRFRELAEWKKGVPRERLVINARVSTVAEVEPDAAAATISTNGSPNAADGPWICPKGHRNRAEANFCEYCDERVPRPPQLEPVATQHNDMLDIKQPAVPDPIALPDMQLEIKRVPITAPKMRMCLNGHELPADAMFCSKCGAPEPPTPTPAVRMCLNGHELPADAMFCSKCGAPPQPPTPTPAVRMCLNGHELPADAMFCSKCGASERLAAPIPAVRLCLNGHELPAGAMFCSKCGQPVRDM